MSTPTKLDAAAVRWLRSIATSETWEAAERFIRADDLTLLALIPDEGEKEATDSPGAQGRAPELWVTGPRTRLRKPVTALFHQRLDERLAWLIQWLEGRWPRGKMVLKLPLGGEASASWVMHAPMPPTRLLLSQGPLPLDREAVAHFKRFHQALGVNHLFSGGFEVRGDTVVRLRAAWRVPIPSVAMALAAWSVDVGNEDVIPPLLAAFPDKASVSLEVGYTPAPAPTIRLTLPGRTRRAVVDVTPNGEANTYQRSWLVQL